MPNVSRPDLLPFALPDTIGLPYHGLVTDGDPSIGLAGVLALPNATTMAYPQPIDGSTVAVQHPRAAAATRSIADQAYDAARGREWRVYALLSGRNRQIGGQELGPTYHLYCDANVTWRVRTTVTAGTGSFIVRVYLSGLFGFIPADGRDYSMSERLLVEQAFYPINRDGSSASTKTVGNRSCRTFDKTGAKMILQVGTTDGSFPSWQTSLYSQGCTTGLLHDVLRITLSGNGSLVPGNIGSGITAAIVSAHDGNDFWVYESKDPDVGWIEAWRWGYVTDKDGNETNAEQYVDHGGTGYIYDTGYSYGYEQYENAYFKFGGYTYTSTASFVGEYHYSGPLAPARIGTETINGVETEIANNTYTLWNHVGFGGESVLPLVCIAQAENLAQMLITASGHAIVWPHYSGDVITHNAYTDEVTHGGSDYVCYV